MRIAACRPDARGTNVERKCRCVLRLLAAVGTLFVLGALPAQAQGVAPTSVVEIDVDPGPAGIPLGMSHDIPFQVTLELSNIVCPQAATATVTLAIKDLPSPLRGVQGNVPATLAFEVPMSASIAGSAYQQTMDATLSINVTAESLPDHEHTFEVTATFDGTLQGCQAAGAIPSAEGSAQHKIKTGPAAAAGVARGATASTSTSPDSGSKGAPAPTALLLVAAVLVAAMVRRR